MKNAPIGNALKTQWKKTAGTTDNYFYKRAVAICAEGKDPMEPLPTKPLE